MKKNKCILIEGYIKIDKFGKLSKNKNNTNVYYEKVKIGAFNKAITLFGDNIPLVLNHEKQIVLDDIKKSLVLCERDKKLMIKATIRDSKVINLILNGEVKGFSFGFIPYKYKDISKNNINIRYLDIFRLTEITLSTKKTVYGGEITKIINLGEC